MPTQDERDAAKDRWSVRLANEIALTEARIVNLTADVGKLKAELARLRADKTVADDEAPRGGRG